jgi:hypothetical protein
MSDKTVGELIQDLTQCNIEIWHEATKIKTLNGVPRDMSASEKVAIGQVVRAKNAERSKLRWEIDNELEKEPLNDSKVNYTEEN